MYHNQSTERENLLALIAEQDKHIDRLTYAARYMSTTGHKDGVSAYAEKTRSALAYRRALYLRLRELDGNKQTYQYSDATHQHNHAVIARSAYVYNCRAVISAYLAEMKIPRSRHMASVDRSALCVYRAPSVQQAEQTAEQAEQTQTVDLLAEQTAERQASDKRILDALRAVKPDVKRNASYIARSDADATRVILPTAIRTAAQRDALAEQTPERTERKVSCSVPYAAYGADEVKAQTRESATRGADASLRYAVKEQAELAQTFDATRFDARMSERPVCVSIMAIGAYKQADKYLRSVYKPLADVDGVDKLPLILDSAERYYNIMKSNVYAFVNIGVQETDEDGRMKRDDAVCSALRAITDAELDAMPQTVREQVKRSKAELDRAETDKARHNVVIALCNALDVRCHIDVDRADYNTVYSAARVVCSSALRNLQSKTKSASASEKPLVCSARDAHSLDVLDALRRAISAYDSGLLRSDLLASDIMHDVSAVMCLDLPLYVRYKLAYSAVHARVSAERGASDHASIDDKTSIEQTAPTDEDRERQAELAQALDAMQAEIDGTLTEAERKAYTLIQEDGATIRSVAAKLGITRNAVDKAVRQARAKYAAYVMIHKDDFKMSSMARRAASIIYFDDLRRRERKKAESARARERKKAQQAEQASKAQ